jgi:hypothetical protein
MAASYWREIWRMINGAGTSTYFEGDAVRVKRNDSFKALPISKQSLINARIENEQKARMFQYCKTMDSLDDVKRRSAELVPLVLNNYKTSKPLSRSVMDSIANLPTMSGVKGQDPATINDAVPNI